MGKWVFENHQGTQVYYSADVIEKIYKIAKWSSNYYNNKNDDVLQCAEKHQRIVDIIENEDK